MPTRDSAPIGAPCWADLWTSDVEGSRKFYGELFGWEAQEPSPEFGGYFMFTRNGVPIAGAMGAMGDMPANDSWKIYLDTDDIAKTVAAAEAQGAHVIAPVTPIADLGTQAVLVDPTGAQLGAWQPGTFPGFTVLNEHGAPSWFELHTRDHAGALAFYGDVFDWETTTISDTDEFRYTVVRSAGMDDDMAGINDAARFLADGERSAWSIYWEVEDARAAADKATSLGASVVHAAEDSPYGVLATLRDPAGAEFRLRTAPSA
jgi:predicted enzyme related to lactoylglutathione lyase